MGPRIFVQWIINLSLTIDGLQECCADEISNEAASTVPEFSRQHGLAIDSQHSRLEHLKERRAPTLDRDKAELVRALPCPSLLAPRLYHSRMPWACDMSEGVLDLTDNNAPAPCAT